MEPDNPPNLTNLNPLPPAPAPTAATPTLQPNQDDRPTFPLKVGALGLVLVVLVIGAVFLFLNKQKSGQTAEDLAVSLSQPERSTRPFIRCPVAQDQCAGGQTVDADTGGETIYALRFSGLGSGLQVLAAIAGERNVESGNSFLITNTERGIELRYVTEGEFVFEDEGVFFYEEKGPIGTFGGGENTLTIYAKSMNTGKPIHLGIGEGGEFLTNLE